MKLESIKRLWCIWKIKPYISLSKYGQMLPDRNMRVSVTLHSRYGAQGVYDFPDDDRGNARAQLAANTMAHISNFPLLDNR